MTPLPLSLREASADRQGNQSIQVSTSGEQPTARGTAQTVETNLKPITPPEFIPTPRAISAPDMPPALASQFGGGPAPGPARGPGDPRLQLTAPPQIPLPGRSSEPAAFLPPTTSDGERRMPSSSLSPTSPTETALPRALRLAPTNESNRKTFEGVRETAEELARQTEEIRIIPGGHRPRPLTPPGELKLDPIDRAVKTPTGQVEKPSAPAEWKTRPLTSLSPAQPGERLLENMAQRPASSGNSPTTPALGDDQSRFVRQADPAPPERQSRESRTVFDLASLLTNPEFREIHTAPVLEGLELLSRRDPRHRARGAIRIAAAGHDARTALPILRKLLAVETEKTVRLRIAETLLKVQPSDAAATECLSTLLNDRNDWELRQNAATAFAGVAREETAGHNPVAIARLTDALDDSNPRVRMAAAVSLGQFGPAAADSIARLETAAAGDVPAVQEAASAALVSIKGAKPQVATAQAPRQADAEDQTTAFPFATTSLIPSPATIATTTSTATTSLEASSGRVRLTDQFSAETQTAIRQPAPMPVRVEARMRSPRPDLSSRPPKLLTTAQIGELKSLAPPLQVDEAPIPVEGEKRGELQNPAELKQPIELKKSDQTRKPRPSSSDRKPSPFQLEPLPRPRAMNVAPQDPSPVTPSTAVGSGAGAGAGAGAMELERETGSAKASTKP